MTRVAAGKRGASYAFGCSAVGFDQKRRETLPPGLVAESIHEIFWWELICGVRLITEKVADRVIVLSVRQASKIRL
jgi:hypothetical protein